MFKPRWALVATPTEWAGKIGLPTDSRVFKTYRFKWLAKLDAFVANYDKYMMFVWTVEPYNG